MIKVIDNSKVLTMLTNSSTCQVAAHHCQNKMNGFLCPAFGIVFSPPSTLFQLCLEKMLVEELENTPSAKIQVHEVGLVWVPRKGS
jgi:hypothetical protein